MKVTDLTWTRKSGKIEQGFYMDHWLKQNLDGIPWYLEKAYDVVGIISGHGKVRIGKSTMAAQVATYVAWLLAGGRMPEDENGNIIEIIPPIKPFTFNLEENYAFAASELQEKASKLYKKYGKNQIIVYDEGRQGLDSARAMESVNKGMQDFFQECGRMGHVILIVLPNFFKLHEDYAIARSLFLIDVYASEKLERGRFAFYNERRKELLYEFGKKKLGVTAKYTGTNPNFSGRFTSWFPFASDAYDKLKEEALEKKSLNKHERNTKMVRDVLAWLLMYKYNVKPSELQSHILKVTDLKYDIRTLEKYAETVVKILDAEKGYDSI